MDTPHKALFCFTCSLTFAKAPTNEQQLNLTVLLNDEYLGFSLFPFQHISTVEIKEQG